MSDIRSPAVAGRFYEADPARLSQQIDECYDSVGKPAGRERAIGAVVPHAGLMYSGHVAAAAYGLLRIPPRVIILCPNHTGQGHPAAINDRGEWRTPLGTISVDRELATELMSAAPRLRHDTAAHACEHSLEVQLPFLQSIEPSMRLVPICLGSADYSLAEEVGNGIASVVAAKALPNEEILILASSDLNHYESQAVTLEKDQRAIDRILELDPAGLWRVATTERVSMCGFIPTTAMLIAAKALGASAARLIRHATSGDISGDYSAVVGYASILIS